MSDPIPKGDPQDEQPRKVGRQIFRVEAVVHHAAGQRGEGAVLQISPAWTLWAFPLLVTTVAFFLFYIVVGTVHEYAVGPALARVEGRRQITATVQGVVHSVEVDPGEHIQAGDVLITLNMEEELAEYAKIDRQYELQLVKTLRNPGDEQAGKELAGLSTARMLAKAHVEERSIRATAAGVVSDVRVHPGQRLNLGDTLLAINGRDAKWSVIAMLPGEYRPMLDAGAILRLEMVGFRYAYREIVVDSVGDEIVGPNAVRRFLGDEIADAVPLDGPVVLVRASLPSSSFEVDGLKYQYYEGLHGRAEVRVRTSSILFTLVPGLRLLFGGSQT